MSKDIDKTGISYLQTFAQNVYLLAQQAAAYGNLILKLEMERNKEKGNDIDLTEEQSKNLNDVIEILRHTLYLTIVQYKSIVGNIKQMKLNENLIKNYEEIKKTYVIDREILDELVLDLNIELMSGTIKDLLETSQQIIDQLYSSENEKPKN